MTINKIKSCIKNRFLWISIDKITDAVERYVENVTIGILDTNEQIARQIFLINTAHLEKANYSTIVKLFDDFVKIRGEEFKRDSLLLLVSDAAPYMVKAASAIKIFYPKMTHVTCLAQGSIEFAKILELCTLK